MIKTRGESIQAGILDSLTTSVMYVGAELRTQHINPSAEQLLGISASQLSNISLAEFLGADHVIVDVIRRVLETGQPFSRREIHLESKNDADTLIVDCRVTPLGSNDDRAALVELTDATRSIRISRENALLAQHGASRASLRQLAHEIKNPLGGLRGAAQLLERELRNPKLAEYTQLIIGEADRLADLVDTLLGPGRMPKKSMLSIHELLQYVVQLVEAEKPDGVTVERDYDPSLPSMNLDRDQIVQALLNLTRNALNAVGETGHIILRSRALSQFTIGKALHRVVASIEIEVNGSGIPADLSESIFYPLVSGHHGGTGLGLPLAQELVNRHGGLIEFTSRPGRTIFQMLLPLYNSSMKAEP